MTAPNSRTLSVEFLIEFIRIYKSHTALWKVKSKEYANKNLKKIGYDELVEWSRTAIPTANKDFVLRKINSLRGAFRKEHRKVKQSQRNGDAEVYVPNLWYYNLLMFTANCDKSDDDENDNDNDDTINDVCITNESHNEVNTPISRTETIEIPSLRTQKRRNIKEETRDENIIYLHHTPSPINDTQSSKYSSDKKDDEYDAFGFLIATKLRKMSEEQRIHAEFLINKIIHNGLLNNLNSNTNVVDNL